MTLIDLSPPIDATLAVWPGDTAPRREVLLDMQRGDHLTLSTLHATVHLGAHADAPSHYGTTAATAEQLDLNRYVGPCTVVAVSAERGRRLEPGDVAIPSSATRVLLRTDTFLDPTQFNRNFVGLSPALIEILADAGVTLIGVDTPSVDPFESTDLEAHHTCLDRDVAILEGLVMHHVTPGRYELIALPLPLVGFDASPVRAVLRPEIS